MALASQWWLVFQKLSNPVRDVKPAFGPHEIIHYDLIMQFRGNQLQTFIIYIIYYIVFRLIMLKPEKWAFRCLSIDLRPPGELLEMKLKREYRQEKSGHLRK